VTDSRPAARTPELLRAIVRAIGWIVSRIRGNVVELVGGPARARVIILFGAVLALSGADTATIGAMAPQLEHALHIGNARVGLLSSVSLLIGAVFTVPVGLLVDRSRRIPLLAGSIVLWSLASLASAFAASFSDLVLTRLALGAVTATAGPAIASLAGDYFAANERGRVYAYILAGETAGAALGFIVSGSVASLTSWRVPFVLLAIPGAFLARSLWRTVPEPLRGGQSHLAPGAEVIAPVPGAAGAPAEPRSPQPAEVEENEELARSIAQRRGIRPVRERILNEDGRSMPIMRSIAYILSIPSNWLMIVSSSLGYFFFAGLQTFALLFVRGQYHASQATSEFVLAVLVLGALVGAILGGYVSDLLLRRGFLTARVWVPAVCYGLSVVLLIPGFVSHSLTPALWFDTAGAALISAANAPLNAARLDIMPAPLWGRAEGARTFIRSLMQAIAPLVFGEVSNLIAGFVPRQAPIGTHPGNVSHSTATGLEVTFLVMLVTLAAAAVFLVRAARPYSRDVATADASEAAARSRAAPPPGIG
jgi:MFS family permease